MDAKEFKKRLAELQSVITIGLGYFKAWATLYDRNEETAHALNRYRGFFLLVQDSLKDMALLKFANVFDHDSRTCSLRPLLQAAKECRDELTPHATMEDLLNLEAEINRNADLLERLKGVRDQRIAHRDSKYKQRSILYGEMNKLIDDIQAMFNSVSKWHDRSVTIFDSFGQDAEKHTTEVIQIMREERKRFIQRRKDLFKKTSS